MSVKEIKQYDPPLSVAEQAWKWFALHEDGTLGPLTYYFSEGAFSGAPVKLGAVMESKHGYWAFRDERLARRYGSAHTHLNMILLPVKAIDILADGLQDTLPCSKFKAILVELPPQDAAQNQPQPQEQASCGETAVERG